MVSCWDCHRNSENVFIRASVAKLTPAFKPETLNFDFFWALAQY